MNELEKIIKKLYTAGDNSSSLKVSYRYWYKHYLMKRVENSWKAADQDWTPPHFAIEIEDVDETPQKYKRRFWLQNRSRLRYEVQQVGQETSITVISEDCWWEYHPGKKYGKLYTNVMPEEDFPVHKGKTINWTNFFEEEIKKHDYLDPSFLPASHYPSISGECGPYRA